MRREWIEMKETVCRAVTEESPSMRREWIEIYNLAALSSVPVVSLHAEGVD